MLDARGRVDQIRRLGRAAQMDDVTAPAAEGQENGGRVAAGWPALPSVHSALAEEDTARQQKTLLDAVTKELTRLRAIRPASARPTRSKSTNKAGRS